VPYPGRIEKWKSSSQATRVFGRQIELSLTRSKSRRLPEPHSQHPASSTLLPLDQMDRPSSTVLLAPTTMCANYGRRPKPSGTPRKPTQQSNPVPSINRHRCACRRFLRQRRLCHRTHTCSNGHRDGGDCQ
jgi:hypothetical protein